MIGIPYICKLSSMAENTSQQEAVMEQSVICVAFFIPKEKRNLYVKSLKKFI